MPNNNTYGLWPMSGELDMAETRANRNLTLSGVNIGTSQMGSTIHVKKFYLIHKINFQGSNPFTVWPYSIIGRLVNHSWHKNPI